MQHSKNPDLNQSEAETEISLSDILHFLKNTYKTILVFGVLGITAAIIYLAMTPNQYEATVQIAMAKIGTPKNSTFSPGISIEEPALMIARLSNIASLTSDEITACGFEGHMDSAALVKTIKLAPVKGVPDVVELKTFGITPEAAKSCANSIFLFAKKTQANLVGLYIEEVKAKLADVEEQINAIKKLALRFDKSEMAMLVVYLSTRDEMRRLLDDKIGLKNILASNQNQETSLMTPIYTSNLPISPKKRMTFTSGLFGGLLFGFFIALACQMITKNKELKTGEVLSKLSI